MRRFRGDDQACQNEAAEANEAAGVHGRFLRGVKPSCGASREGLPNEALAYIQL